jgi:hypothetical protein
MTFLTIGTHNKMLDATCDRNLGTTYLNDLEVTAEIPFHCSFRTKIPN